MNGRIGYIDLMKGLGIMYVMMMHAGLFSELRLTNGFVSTWEVGCMPMFFFLSGVFFRNCSGFREFALRKFHSLLIPHLFFGLVCGLILTAIPFSGHSLREAATLSTWKTYALCSPNGFWFLRALFCGSVMLYGLHKLAGDKLWRTLSVSALVVAVHYIVFMSVGDMDVSGRGVVATWTRAVVQGAVQLPFLWLGYLVGRCGALRVERTRKTLAAASATAVAALVTSLFVPFYDASWHVPGFEGGWFYTMPTSLLSIFFVWSASFVLDYLPYVSYLGRYSLIVLCTHFPFLRALHKMFEISHMHAFIVVAVCTPLIIYVCVHRLPWVCAQKPFPELFRIKFSRVEP